MKNISNDIKEKNFKKVYLLYGEESYLVKVYKDKLIEAITSGDPMNTMKYEGDKIDVVSLIDDINTAPFFADYRLVVIENTNLFKKANDDLVDAIGNIPDGSIVLFVEKEVDKRGKLYKQIKSKGYPCEMGYLSESDLSNWTLKQIGGYNKKISRETLDLFISKTDGDMYMVSNEIAKLVSYVGDRDVIESKDVEELCQAPVVGKIFDMTDAMSVKNKKKTMELYYDLIAAKEAPAYILTMLIRQFDLLLTTKELADKGYGVETISKEMKVHSFVIKKCFNQSRNFDIKTLKLAYKASIKMMEKIRSGLMDEKVGVEMLLMKYSG